MSLAGDIADIRRFVKGMSKWMLARNKVLWTGSWANNSTLVIPDIDKYEVISITLAGFAQTILTSRYPNGSFYIGLCNDSDVQDIYRLLKQTEKDTYRLNDSASGSWRPQRIIGVEPKLSEFFGGGYKLIQRF